MLHLCQLIIIVAAKLKTVSLMIEWY